MYLILFTYYVCTLICLVFVGNHRNAEWCLIRSFTHFQLSQSAVSCHMLLRTQNGWFLKFLSKKVFDKNLCTRPLNNAIFGSGKKCEFIQLVRPIIHLLPIFANYLVTYFFSDFLHIGKGVFFFRK